MPDVGEKISYKMPTFVLDGLPLVHVAAWKKHLGLYPLPPMDDELAAAVEPYRGGQGRDAAHVRPADPLRPGRARSSASDPASDRMDGVRMTADVSAAAEAPAGVARHA